MFTISVEKSFSARHALAFADDSKEPAHSHDWLVVAAVSAEELDERGLVMDFRRLQAIIEDITSELEGDKLEQLDYFQRNNSSAENVAKYIYDRIAAVLPSELNLDWVRVTEAPGCAAKYRR